MFKQIGLLMLLLLPLFVKAESSQPLDKVVAIVNDGVITASELNSQVEALRRQIQSRNMQVPPENVLRKQVLQHLIDVNLQLQLAKQNSITVDGSEVNEAIANIAKNNKFSMTDLRNELNKQGIAWKVYRENIRKEILLARLQQKAVNKEIDVSAKQIDDYLKTVTQEDNAKLTYHLQNIVIPLSEEPTTEELKKAQQKAQDLLAKIKQGKDFSNLAVLESTSEHSLDGGDLGVRHLAELPELFAKEVTHMKVGEVAGPLRAGNGYQLIKLVAVDGDLNSQHHQITKTHVRHILLKPDASMTPAESKKQAENLYQQLKSGKDFATMAKQYSYDTVSAAKGGDLGWVSHEDLVPQFAKAMDALPLHQISKPVKTTFGWHLIEVIERKKMDDSIAFRRQQARLALQQRKFNEAVQNWVQHLRGDSYINIMEKQLA